MAQNDFSSFRTRVLAYCQVDGTAFIDLTDDAENDAFRNVANEVLARFSEETYCLFSDRILFVPTQDEGVYSFRDSSVFAQSILEVQRVFIDGAPICETSESDMSIISGRYLTAASAKPTVWFEQPPNQLIISPPPDQVYDNCYVSAWYLHPAVTGETYEDDGDAGIIFLRSEDIEAAAIDTYITICKPRASGKSMERIANMMALNEKTKVKIRQRADVLYAGPQVRGVGQRTVYSFR